MGNRALGPFHLKRMVFESGTIGLGTMGAYLYGLSRYGPGAAASTLASTEGTSD